MEFIKYGHYIIEPVPKPKYVSVECKEILTASMCLCNQHPSLNGSFWMNHVGEQAEYQKRLKLSDQQFKSMKKTVSLLFHKHKLDQDSCFVQLSDAQNFYEEYLFHLPNLHIVSIALENVYRDVFLEEIRNSHNILSPLEMKQAGGTLLGYDILGWDCGSFHTYLCNSLDKEILDIFPLQVNELGLIQNSYMQVKKFSEYIADMGEPVLWLPFAVYQYTTK